jgi:thioester reductase-like protein
MADVRLVGTGDMPHQALARTMRGDAILPDDVRCATTASSDGRTLRDARRVLLTGATGFLGRWIANTLLLDSSAAIVCLVRGESHEIAERLRTALASTGVDRTQFEHRITVVRGDLAKPHLGMSGSEFDAVASSIDAVCHAGATVNWVRPYDALKGSNVNGTIELLKLAARYSTPFHFVSSLSVCYSTTAALRVDETYDPLPDIGGLHLGYAQSKVVAEALVRDAGRRGLPIAVYRPSLISGHSGSGAFNRDDIIARVITGCVRMGVAPDLDWSLDCVPVDVAAERITTTAPRAGAIHLAHTKPRSWRECVLWLRLYGYDVRLVRYRDWLTRLDAETRLATERDHPLRPLRRFFLQRVRTGDRRTLPELMTGADRTFGVIDEVAPPLDATLLQRYCDAFVADGALPEPRTSRIGSKAHGTRMTPIDDVAEPRLNGAFLSRVMKRHVDTVEPQGRLSAHSVISELTSWKAGSSTGLFRYRIVDDGVVRDVVVKITPHDRDVIAVGSALAHMCDADLGRAYDRWSDRLGIIGAAQREVAIYGQQDPRFTMHSPVPFALAKDDGTGLSTLVLESLTDTVLQDSVERPELWQPTHIECAIRGLSTLHAIWFNRTSELARQSWIGYVPNAAGMIEMTGFWRALAEHARPAFTSWAGGTIATIHDQLIDQVGDWWRRLDDLPRTLIHHDFNPRNICLRNGPTGPRLAAYDWELATIGVPQRDLVELLCFVLPERPAQHEVRTWIERHRTWLEGETGTRIDRTAWIDGFRAALYDLMLTRLPMYALIDRVRRQSFLPRVLRVWSALYRQFPLGD